MAENLKFENPRNLPKSPEQIFLDRLGGTIRMAEVVGEFFSSAELLSAMKQVIDKTETRGAMNLGISGFGVKKDMVNQWLYDLKAKAGTAERKVRIANQKGELLTSGKIFHDKLLKKGTELIVWKNGDSYLLAQTKANQNLRNYELRDRKKEFRDARMGMLPPKLAQILLNLAQPTWDETVIDPFCGSGTVNIEAAITGYKTYGSDINGEFASQAQGNFEQMAEKFRYDPAGGTFKASDILELGWKNMSGVIATEGWLGQNFTHAPDQGLIDKNSQLVMDMWKDIFGKLESSNVRRLAFCLPAWNFGLRKISISQQLFNSIKGSSYKPIHTFGGNFTTFYEREGAYVAREVCVVERV